MSNVVPPSACLSCGYVSDRAADVFTHHKPSADDITICIACGYLMAFDKKLRMRELTMAEFKEAVTDTRVLKIQQARSEIIEREKNKGR
jgi:Zn ribbon nucleic-acid-binding protein